MAKRKSGAPKPGGAKAPSKGGMAAPSHGAGGPKSPNTNK